MSGIEGIRERFLLTWGDSRLRMAWWMDEEVDTFREVDNVQK